MPHHIEDGDNVGSQPGHVAPDTQSGGSLCAGSDTSRYESVDSDKKGTSDDASDEACEQENSKFGWTNDPAP